MDDQIDRSGSTGSGAQPEETWQRSATGGARSQGRVLLADDDAVGARSLARVLERAGFRVDTAPDGRIAIEILKGGEFDVVLSDITMPTMSGLDLLRAVREYDLDTPVILMTAGPDVRTAIKAMEYGALRYLTKPIDNAVLVAEIGYAVGLCRMARLKREALHHIGDLDKFVGDRAGIESRFQRALGRIAMVYQPIVSWAEHEVHAYEALVRSGEPTLANPALLFDAAERTRNLQPLGRVIRSQVANGARHGDGLLFVNLHPEDLNDDELFTRTAPLSQLAHRVVLEITERASLDGVKNVRERVDALRALGFKIAIDDLGAGYAGLASFAQLQPDFAKLDMSLVRNIDQDTTRQHVVGTMTRLCRDLGVLVVAEGIETEAERDALIELDCDLLQGYLFARPGPAFPPVAW
jgi:EAL domain-containing protein (putative c-di-GMP-specific phosphodiesterase class I)/ActR/RegA family two-component response regulator